MAKTSAEVQRLLPQRPFSSFHQLGDFCHWRFRARAIPEVVVPAGMAQSTLLDFTPSALPAPDPASDRRTNETVVAGVMAGRSSNYCAFDAAL